jgi:hypothetical protein
VGLDFGTYSTKVLMQPRGQEKAEVIQIEPSTEGYPWFATPSLVRVVDRRVFFGRKALQTSGGTLFRSLKVRLLPPTEGNAPDDPPCTPPRPPSQAKTKPTEGNAPDDPKPELLVAGYLSWALRSVKEQIEARHKYGTPTMFLNMAAPMNHVEQDVLKTRYLRIIQAAWESVFGDEAFPAEQGMALKDLKSWFAPWLREKVPDRRDRRYDVLPETLAPIVSLTLDPRMGPGMYMIVDVGAGTTELSVNHVNERGADQRVVCYEDESVVFGGDNFSWIQQCFCGDPDTIQQRHRDLVERFLKIFKRTWAKGYRKDAPNHQARERWRQLRVLLTGGGARCAGIEDAIRRNGPMYAWPPGDWKEYRVEWHEPTGIDMRARRKNHSVGDNRLLSVAHGLTVPRQQWPIFYPPGDVQEQHPTEVIEKLPPYWYCEG